MAARQIVNPGGEKMLTRFFTMWLASSLISMTCALAQTPEPVGIPGHSNEVPDRTLLKEQVKMTDLPTDNKKTKSKDPAKNKAD